MTIVALVLWAFIRYVPLLVKSHLAFIASMKDQGERIVTLTANNSAQATGHFYETKKTNRALAQACDLLDVYADGDPRETEIRHHVSAIRKELRGEST
jgi:hypothetical protein